MFNLSFFYQLVSNPIKEHLTGVVAEWLSRKTRNLVPSGAQVRILPTSIKGFLFAYAWLCCGGWACGGLVVNVGGCRNICAPAFQKRFFLRRIVRKLTDEIEIYF